MKYWLRILLWLVPLGGITAPLHAAPLVSRQQGALLGCKLDSQQLKLTAFQRVPPTFTLILQLVEH